LWLPAHREDDIGETRRHVGRGAGRNTLQDVALDIGGVSRGMKAAIKLEFANGRRNGVRRDGG
jgi:hypothetical protein